MTKWRKENDFLYLGQKNMAYNENLAYRIRQSLKIIPEEFSEKKMFGGLSFLYGGKMTVGIVKDDLVVGCC